jgi:AcrR family transcriptional regulator
MPRWEVGSEERLKEAAMELFEEQGFENTSTIQIAGLAGVTNRTFFRYFFDKPEVLFSDSERLRAALVEGIRSAPSTLTPLETVAHALAEFDWRSLGSRESQRRRRAVIDSSPGLLERDLIKQHTMAQDFVEALLERGVDADIARLATGVGICVFTTAYDQWIHADADIALSEISESVRATLATIVGPS